MWLTQTTGTGILVYLIWLTANDRPTNPIVWGLVSFMVLPPEIAARLPNLLGWGRGSDNQGGGS